MFLFLFDRLKECLDISGPKAAKVVSLDELKKDRRPVLNRASEYLIEVAGVVVINENVVLVQERYFLVNLHIVRPQSVL